ncbi:MAG: prepilin-type N-terminal cleavage/methylation domain-containing protein [Opitutaceae bacterium]|nr:prepilin-type N-terminal cleavage/methylation domain-containing protein [Opitutaceae bacterium]
MPPASAFTLIEILLALALVGLLLVALNAFVFSMGELWGRGTDQRLFEQHVRAVTRYLDQELRAAVLPPASLIGRAPIAGQEVRPQDGNSDNLLTFELPEGTRLVSWPDHPLPEVVCSLQARGGEGLLLLWHSRLETKFADEPPREIVVSPMVTALTYDYYDPDFKRWTTETVLKKDSAGAIETPQRLRLKFTYGALTRESEVTLPVATEGLPGL